MKATQVNFKGTKQTKALAVVSIVLDNCLKLDHIRLYRKPEGKYYLVFPSVQDVSQQLQKNNPNVVIKCPKREKCEKKWDEFYFPMKSEFYEYLLEVVLDGYKVYRKEGKRSFYP